MRPVVDLNSLELLVARSMMQRRHGGSFRYIAPPGVHICIDHS